MHTTQSLADTVLERVFIQYCHGYTKYGNNCMSRPHFFAFLADLQFLDDIEEFEIAKVFDKQLETQKDFTFASTCFSTSHVAVCHSFCVCCLLFCEGSRAVG